MREIPRPPPSNLSTIIGDGQGDGEAYDAMMQLLLRYPYQKIRASSDFAPPGASLARRMEGWEDMPYPQVDTIEELKVAVLRKQLAPEDLAAVQEAIITRGKQPSTRNHPQAG